MKKLLSVFLAFALLLSLTIPISAANIEAVDAANTLYELGLFSGTGTDADGNPIFDLDRGLTRQEAVVMLVRLLGGAQYALDEALTAPFADVSGWAMPYIGYAYENGLARGVSETSFGADDPVTAEQFLTFILRALGYSSATDFSWDESRSFAESVGLIDARTVFETPFTRGDACIVCRSALSAVYRGIDDTLQALIEEAASQGTTIARVLEGRGVVMPPQMQDVPDTTEEPTPQEETDPSIGAVVYITKTGEKYHRSGCQYLRQSCIEISRSSAVAQGYTPCSRCKP